MDLGKKDATEQALLADPVSTAEIAESRVEIAPGEVPMTAGSQDRRAEGPDNREISDSVPYHVEPSARVEGFGFGAGGQSSIDSVRRASLLLRPPALPAPCSAHGAVSLADASRVARADRATPVRRAGAAHRNAASGRENVRDCRLLAE